MDKLPKINPSVWDALRAQVVVKDCLFLCFVGLFSIILYVRGLGFYSDDWAFLRDLSLSKNQSLFGLIRFFLDSSGMWVRPVQAVYLAALYWLFGLHPLGYHLVNSAVLILGIVLFHLVLREMNQNRWLALAVPMVYGLLPHYSTDRFWYVAFQANLSMALYFLSLACDLRMLKAGPRHLWYWKVLGIASLLGSTLAYELFIPLFLLLNPLLVLYQRRQLASSTSGTEMGHGKLAVLLGSNLLLLLLVVVFKSSMTDRLQGTSIGWRIQVCIASTIAVNFGDYGLGLPQVIRKIIANYPNAAVFASAGVLALAIFGYLYRVTGQSKTELPRWSAMLKSVGLGLVVSGLCYAYQLSWTTPTGINNRTASAAAVGVAFSLVGGLGWISNLLTSAHSRKSLFCLLVALLCMGGFLINNTIASFWIAAYRQQQEILAGIRQQFPTLPAGTTLILDGFCPYIGPGIVFETEWDVTGALGVIYRDRTLRGDVIKPNLKVKKDAISLWLYDYFESNYPYTRLFVYNFGRRITIQLTDADAARRYFAIFNPDYSNGCPEGHEGYGVSIWDPSIFSRHWFFHLREILRKWPSKQTSSY